MESNTASSSDMWGCSSRKRKPSPEFQAKAVEEDIELVENGSAQSSHQLESKYRELEARFDSMITEFNAMKSENKNLTLQVQSLQKQNDRLLSNDRDLESRIARLEYRSYPTEIMNSSASRQIYNSEQYSQNMTSDNINIDQLVRDFEGRCDLVESNNQQLTERVDSYEQNYFQMRSKTEGVENQLISLQQSFNKLQMQDKNIQQNEIISTQQPVENNTHQTSDVTVKPDLTDSMNISEDQLANNNNNNNNRYILPGKTLCSPCESQILLSTDLIQYGLFDVCDKYKVILLKENDKLQLYDYQKKIDERSWGELGHGNFVTCIHWCSFLDKFLILYRFKLYVLSLKLNHRTSQMELDNIELITSIRVYSLKRDVINRSNNAMELLRFVTTSPNLPGYLYLNRGYRRIELINTNSWKLQRGWSKHDLNYGERDEIRCITFSDDGTYLAMNINWNDHMRFVDFRKHDSQLTLMKRIRMPDDSLSLSQRVQIPSEKDKWLVIDEMNHCYKVSTDVNEQHIIRMQTDHIEAIENIQIRLRFVRNSNYILVGAVKGNNREKQGVFSFYKYSA